MYVSYQPTAKEIVLQKQLRSLAHSMRLNPTSAEAKLWQTLKGKSLNGFKFRRQHPLFSYIVDFYCSQAKLIIEVDGPIHDHQIPRDQSRDAFFKQQGCKILRFKNKDIYLNLDSVKSKIEHLLSQVGEEGGR
jgi:very-short-patch-repair endonuclease